MKMIEWKKETNPVEAWSVRSEDGLWQLDYNGRKEKECRHWLYNFRVAFGTFAPSEEEALPCFIKALKKHIDAEQELVAANEGKEAAK